MLPLSGAITDFALATDAKGVFQGVMRLALVQADLGTTLHVGVQQPINDEERALDAADFAQGQSEVMLARISVFRSTPPRGGRLTPEDRPGALDRFRSTPPRGGRRLSRKALFPDEEVGSAREPWG